MPEDSEVIDNVSLMFECARSLIGGVKIIIASEGIEEDGIVKHPTIPVIVCSAFAIEIQLKALLQSTGTPRPKGDGHDLELLFYALPPDLQKTLLQNQSSYTSLTPDAAAEALRANKDAFKAWRYPYEKSQLASEPAFLLSFALSLSDYLNATLPIVRSMNGWLKRGVTSERSGR